MSEKKLKRPFSLKAAMDKSVEGVGLHAFQAIYKVQSDGLPPDDKNGNALWHSNTCQNPLSEEDSQKVARLALEIENQAKTAIVKMFLYPGFMDNLLEKMVAKNARNLKNSHRKTMTDVIQQYFEADPENIKKSPREAFRELLREGQVILEERDGKDGYVVVDASNSNSKGRFLKKTSLASTYSNAKKNALSNLNGDTLKI